MDSIEPVTDIHVSADYYLLWFERARAWEGRADVSGYRTACDCDPCHC